MRDTRCDKKSLEAIIKLYPGFIEDEKDDISIILQDEKEGIQRYTRDNRDRLYDTKLNIVMYIIELMHAQYSYGMDMREIDTLYNELFLFIYDINIKDIGYINFLHLIAYGILLQKDPDVFEKLVEKMDEEKVNDILLDSLLQAYGLQRSFHSDEYAKENPYIYLVEIINAAYIKKDNICDLLYDYMTKKWLKGHSDLGWGRSVKESGFRGLWSYEAAAVVKLFGIDDSTLNDVEFYPYDFAHYKPTTIKPAERIAIPDQKEFSYEAEEDLIIDAKEIIPPCMYKKVNDFLKDYKNLSDEAFCKKYEFDQVWFDVNDYIKYKSGKEILGMLLVFYLAVEGYILQLDWKEDFEDFRYHMKNYWSKDGETKVITFELDNDQMYFATIPVQNSVHNLFEISVKEYK
ncbi:MAG: DUF1911 domain-containing protein [Butyrivibrio sp.]|nr:DUF1911 domain-containing protein [Butyrivibrio sp.]MBQ5476161.1 DUF1911 domain-containing protein [Lachnospiraceae bacterium]